MMYLTPEDYSFLEIQNQEALMALSEAYEEEQLELDMNSSWKTIPDRINESDNLGDMALDRVIEAINSATNWLDSMYLYAGPNGSKVENLNGLQKVMTPRDWAIYCILNRIECDLHI